MTGNFVVYRHTPEMGEISGFGGGYEDVCQNMLEAGVNWLDANPDARPEGHGFKNIYGIFEVTNDDGLALEKVVLEASGNEATGAMMQAVMQRLLQIRDIGWDQYKAEILKDTSNEPPLPLSPKVASG